MKFESYLLYLGKRIRMKEMLFFIVERNILRQLERLSCATPWFCRDNRIKARKVHFEPIQQFVVSFRSRDMQVLQIGLGVVLGCRARHQVHQRGAATRERT
jgi:hypothetical protein